MILSKEEKAKLPEIDLSLGGVTARCFASDVYLGLMKEHGLNNEGLNEGLNLSEKAKIVYELIKKLSEELKCIRRNGSKKTGYWEIIMEDK